MRTVQNKAVGKSGFCTLVNLRIVDFELKHTMVRDIDFLDCNSFEL